jgi:hypothetical protein
MAAHSLVKAVMSWASTMLLMLFIVVFTILLWSINEMSYIYFYRKKKSECERLKFFIPP